MALWPEYKAGSSLGNMELCSTVDHKASLGPDLCPVGFLLIALLVEAFLLITQKSFVKFQVNPINHMNVSYGRI